MAADAEILWDEILEGKYPEEGDITKKNAALDYMHDFLDKAFHIAALERNQRADGRAVDEIRKLYAKAGGISPVLS